MVWELDPHWWLPACELMQLCFLQPRVVNQLGPPTCILSAVLLLCLSNAFENIMFALRRLPTVALRNCARPLAPFAVRGVATHAKEARDHVMQIEVEVVELYRKLAKEVPEPLNEVFERLAQEEWHHHNVLEKAFEVGNVPVLHESDIVEVCAVGTLGSAPTKKSPRCAKCVVRATDTLASWFAGIYYPTQHGSPPPATCANRLKCVVPRELPATPAPQVAHNIYKGIAKDRSITKEMKSLTDVYINARDNEAKNRDHYLKLAEEETDPEAKKLWQFMALEEQKHFKALDEMVKFITSTDSFYYW